jgi:superfamily I DNA/RNA helicase
VLVLSYNSTLANYLRSLVNDRCREIGANPTLVTCVNFHAFCQRVVDDAKQAGFTTQAPIGKPWYEAIVDQARDAMAVGYRCRFDAVLIDEGQDFTLEWWNFLRDYVVAAGGEMLLVADPTQDVYEQRAWTDEAKMLGAGFSGPWTELTGSYRMPTDMVPIANAFAAKYLDGEHIAGEVPSDHLDLFGSAAATIRHWENNTSPADHGSLIGHEVVRLLTTHPDLSPSDVAFLCDRHDDGLHAVAVIEAAGYPVHHIFARDEQSRTRRKQRFWPDAAGVKGCTVHSFKGWETPALVMGIGKDQKSKRLAYVAMTRIRVGGPGRPAYVSVVNSDLSIAGFDSLFRHWATPSIPVWAPPRADTRIR